MRIIDTSEISATSQYPLDGNDTNKKTGIDFLQLRDDERFDAIMRVLLANLGGVTTLFGSITIGGGNYSCTGMWVYYNYYYNQPNKLGEMFYIAPVSSTSMGSNSYLNVTVSDVADADDPVYYSDGTQQSPHRYRTLILTPSSSPSVGAVDANGIITSLPDVTTIDFWDNVNAIVQLDTEMTTVQGDISTLESEVTANTTAIANLLTGGWTAIAGGIGYQNSWTDIGSPPYNNGRYKLEGSYVVLSGFITGGASNTVAFTLPSGYRPQNDIVIGIGNAADHIVIGSSGSVTIVYSGGGGSSLEGIRFPIN